MREDQPFQPTQEAASFDWERFRADTAAKAVQSFIIGRYIWTNNYEGANYADELTKSVLKYAWPSEDICKAAVRVADELVKQLKEKHETNQV